MIRIVTANGKDELDILGKLDRRTIDTNPEVFETVNNIIEDIRNSGDLALRKYSIEFDGVFPEQLELDRTVLEKSFEAVDGGFRDAIIRISANIKRYHENQRQSGYEISNDKGQVLGQVVRGLDRVGLYVPGGTAQYPSTVLMNGIPAKLAGVRDLIMATPPASGTNQEVMAAAFLAGVDRVILAGGAQIIAAMAYGTESVPKVDKIVGPGNVYVTTAKRLLYGQVDIDMIAGPSEILIIADKKANPRFIAADMLSQAEHDANSAAILLTTDADLADTVKNELEKQLAYLDRRDIARSSIERYGAVIICQSNNQMFEYADKIAPEHVEIMTDDALAAVMNIRNAGSVFCGDFTPEPLGDYYSGTNHVLPTSGTARFASPLGVYDFIKRMSYTCYTKDALETAKNDIMLIAEREGLGAHAAAVRKRFESEE